MKLVREHINFERPESEEDFKDKLFPIKTIYVSIKSSPRSDRNILDLLKNNFKNVSYAGGIGIGGWRIIVIEDRTNIKKISNVLKKYIENGRVTDISI